jgi:hypothetical protein
LASRDAPRGNAPTSKSNNSGAADAGSDRVYVHQVGPDQETFFRFYEREVMPQVAQVAAGTRS